MNSVFPFFKWVGSTSISKLINDSSWMFPAIEAVHIVALALLFGAALVLNLRLLGVMLRGVPVSRLARELAPWTFCSLTAILVSGALLFSSPKALIFLRISGLATGLHINQWSLEGLIYEHTSESFAWQCRAQCGQL